MTHKTVALSGLVLLLVLLGLGAVRQARPWRRWQAEFVELERKQLRYQLATELPRNVERAEALRAAMAEARGQLDGRQEEIRQLADERRRFRYKGRMAQAREARAQARLERLDWQQRTGGPDPGIAAEIEVHEAARRQARMERESFRELEEERARQLAQLRSELGRLEAQWEADGAGVADLERRLEELAAGSLVRGLPVLDLFDPAVRIHEVAPPGLQRSTPSGVLARVDRCPTCHLGADREDLSTSGWPRLHQVHPQPNLYVGASSPHPLRRFGCTVCHGGWGRATDFTRAGHVPPGPGQTAAWRAQWGWRPEAVAPEPILPPALVVAGCLGCHRDPSGLPGAELAAAGHELVAEMSCTGCHGIDPREHPAWDELKQWRHRAPDLTRIAAKTTPGWLFGWLAAPRARRPTTWMPHFFSADPGAEESPAIIAAIVAFLGSRSQRPEYPEPPAGDPEAGQTLFASVGCTGCHLLAAEARRDAFFPLFGRLHGPNLAATGSKVAAPWLFAWLRDPRALSPATAMPDLRLGDQQAADLTACLTTRRLAEWEQPAVPEVDATVRDRLVRSYLEETLTIEASQAALERMSTAEKELFLGQRTIAVLGCHVCHAIPGFEDAAPVAGDLALKGDRVRRSLARGRGVGAVAHGAGWRRPDFGLSPQEAEAVAVTLLGLDAPAVDSSLRPGDDDAVLAAGRRVVVRYGCRGCHRLGGRQPAIDPTLAAGGRPPDLSSEGARVLSQWLFSFLDEPSRSPLRPWLGVRMPSFGLTADERHDLVSYFAARDGQSLLASELPPAEPIDVAVGETVAVMLQCRRCHREEAEAEDLPLRELAPSYRWVRDRLRPDWVVRWILDPQSLIPGTAMPEHFARDAAGRPSSSFLSFALEAPMNAQQRERLLPLFASEQQLRAYLSDPERVATAIRDYLWSAAR